MKYHLETTCTNFGTLKEILINRFSVSFMLAQIGSEAVLIDKSFNCFWVFKEYFIWAFYKWLLVLNKEKSLLLAPGAVSKEAIYL